MQNKIVAFVFSVISVLMIVHVFRHFMSYRFAMENETAMDGNDTWHMADGVSLPFWFIEKDVEQGLAQAPEHLSTLTWLLPITLAVIVITVFIWFAAGVGIISGVFVVILSLGTSVTFLPALFSVYNAGYESAMYLNGNPTYFFFYFVWLWKFFTSTIGVTVLLYLMVQAIHLLTMPIQSEEERSNFEMEQEQRRHNSYMEWLARRS